MKYLWLIFIAMAGLFYYNTIGWLIESWINNPYYSHGFLVPVISGYILFNTRKELAEVEIKQYNAGIALFAGGIFLHGVGVLWTARFISGLSIIAVISGMILFLFGWNFLKKIIFPILFLLLMIPLPFVDIVAPAAQTISVVFSSNLANLLEIPVQREGLELHLQTGSFEVGVPCSGLRSIVSLIMIAALYAFILEGGMLMKLIIVISSIPLALSGNILRITSVLAVANKYGQEVALNYFHDSSSILFFVVSLSGLIFVGRCFGRLKFKKIF